MSHAIDFITGFESLYNDFQDHGKARSEEAIYTQTVLKLRGYDIKNCGGVEGFLGDAASKVWEGICSFCRWIMNLFTGGSVSKKEEEAVEEAKEVADLATKNKDMLDKCEKLADEILERTTALAKADTRVVKRAGKAMAKAAKSSSKAIATDSNIAAAGAANDKAAAEQAEYDKKWDEAIAKLVKGDIEEYRMSDDTKKYIKNIEDLTSSLDDVIKGYLSGIQTSKKAGAGKYFDDGMVTDLSNIVKQYMKVTNAIKNRIKNIYAWITTRSEEKLAGDLPALLRMAGDGMASCRMDIARLTQLLGKVVSNLNKIKKGLGENEKALDKEITTLGGTLTALVDTASKRHQSLTVYLIQLTTSASLAIGRNERSKSVDHIKEFNDMMNDTAVPFDV